jgi:hypothetical protein
MCRYIGKTAYPERRLNEHCSDLKIRTHRSSWIRNVLSNNCIPELLILEETNVNSINEAEKFWIEYAQFLGCKLTNGTKGGTGGTPTESVRLKIQTSCKNLSSSDAYREELSSKQIEGWNKPGVKEKNSIVQKKRFELPSEREKLRQCSISNWDSKRASGSTAQTPRHLAARLLAMSAPLVKEKQVGGIRKAWADPELRAQASISQKKCWADTVEREKRIPAQKAGRERAKLEKLKGEIYV